MALISFDPDIPIDYIPAYAGNRDSDNPCIVKLKFVPYAKVQEYSRLISIKAKGIPERFAEANREYQKKQFIENIESVSGYFISGKEITTANELYETAPAELIYELIRAMEDAAKLSEGQRKNL